MILYGKEVGQAETEDSIRWCWLVESGGGGKEGTGVLIGGSIGAIFLPSLDGVGISLGGYDGIEELQLEDVVVIFPILQYPDRYFSDYNIYSTCYNFRYFQCHSHCSIYTLHPQSTSGTISYCKELHLHIVFRPGSNVDVLVIRSKVITAPQSKRNW